MEINLPLLVDGKFIGDCSVSINPRTNGFRLAPGEFDRLIKPRLEPTVAAKLEAALARDGNLTAADFDAAGLGLAYDAKKLQLLLSLPTVASRPGTISITGYAAAPGDRTLLTEESYSASAILTVTQDVIDDPQGLRTLPFTASGQLAANVGGKKGLSLLSELTLGAQGDRRLLRGQTVLVHDDVNNVIRYQFGDIAPLADGFQGSPLIGGFALERTYQALQPNRNIRPSGLFRFELDQPSVVEITVNGSPVRVMRLERGQYDLRDFNFVGGLNEIEIFVRDDLGRRSIARFSQFFDFNLLSPGLDEFGLYAGFKQVRRDSGVLAYREDQPVISAFYRRGLTSSTTLGVNAQFERGHAMVGATVTTASRIGTFAAIAAASQSDGNQGARFLVSYQKSMENFSILRLPVINLEGGYTTAHFAPVGAGEGRNPSAFEVRARAAATLPGGTNIGLSGSYFSRRDGLSSSYLVSATASRAIGPFAFSLTAEHARTFERRTDNRVLVTLSLPMGRRGNLRTSFDTRNSTVQADWSRFKGDALGDWGGRATLQRDRDGLNGSGELAYNLNRASVFVRYDANADGSLGNFSQRGSVTASSQLAFAGGKFAIGRPVGPNFVIAYPNSNLDSHVEIAQGVELESSQSRSGALGPALGALSTPYTVRRITVRAPEAPPGYDVGTGYYDMQPGVATGFKLKIGTDASLTAMGLMVSRSGEPVALQAGKIFSVDQPEAAPVLFFTNAAGRFVATGLLPGRHRIILGAGQFSAEIALSSGKDNIVKLGTVQVEEGDR